MTSTHITNSTLALLAGNRLRAGLINVLEEFRSSSERMSRSELAVVLGQWFHPLHYFPVYLSRLISIAPGTDEQTAISQILWQELGEGVAEKAHEKIFIETAESAGFEQRAVAKAAPIETTRKLVAGYQEASSSYFLGLGFLYGTEVVDLPMVSTIGSIMTQCTGKKDLPWVEIHVTQEPDHVKSSSYVMRPMFPDEQAQIVVSAERMWKLWIGFFEGIKKEITQRHKPA